MHQREVLFPKKVPPDIKGREQQMDMLLIPDGGGISCKSANKVLLKFFFTVQQAETS